MSETISKTDSVSTSELVASDSTANQPTRSSGKGKTAAIESNEEALKAMLLERLSTQITPASIGGFSTNKAQSHLDMGMAFKLVDIKAQYITDSDWRKIVRETILSYSGHCIFEVMNQGHDTEYFQVKAGYKELQEQKSK